MLEGDYYSIAIENKIYPSLNPITASNINTPFFSSERRL
jgi:hypothetical protein